MLGDNFILILFPRLSCILSFTGKLQFNIVNFDVSSTDGCLMSLLPVINNRILCLFSHLFSSLHEY